MEVGVRITGVLLRILNFLLSPLFWLATRSKAGPVSRPKDPVLFYSVEQLAAKIRKQELTSEQVVTAYIARIKEVNPKINAVVEERYQAAILEANAADKKIQKAGKGEELGPLLGVPFTVKESCSLAGLSNSVGCLELANNKALSDGGAVQAVRAAGAIPLLVSNTPELCLGWETSNLLNGTTNNPYDGSRTPGGSSGGEAALVASAASPFGVVSDIAGSIRVPAAFCGLFGHKPTPGIIPISGHIPELSDPLFPHFLCVGPLTRYAGDAAMLLRVMAASRAKELRLDAPVHVKDLTVYYMTAAANVVALLPTHAAIQKSICAAANHLQKCGATLSEKKFEDLEDSVEISISEFFSMKDIPNMLQDPANPKRNKSLIIELIKYAFGGASRSLQCLGFTFIHKTQLFIPKSRRGFYHEKAKKLKEELVNTLGENGVLLYPVFNGPAHRHNEVFVRASGVMYTMVFNILGFPATVVPMGLHNGIPIAIQVVAAPYQDRLCLAVAKQLEVGFGGWQPPS